MRAVYWSSISPLRLLILAASLHVALAIAFTLIGKGQIVPQTFDTNGVGISFAVDSVSYRREAVHMAQLLREGRVRDWINYRAALATFHARIYSISYALLGWLLGEGLLAIEPVNLFYYLSMLVLIYVIGGLVFSPAIGKLTAVVVGLWPSLLIFSTQLLRDSMYICCFLLLLWTLIVCIKSLTSWKQVVTFTATGLAALSLILLARAAMWEIVLLTVLVAALVSLVSQMRARRFDFRSSLVVLVLSVSVFVLPRTIPGGRVADRYERFAARNPTSATARTDAAPWSKLAAQIGWARHVFIAGYPAAGSNLDAHVEFRTAGDVVQYLPRALELGLLAPFPRMWFSAGTKVGLTGRLVIGAEMIALYAMLLLTLLTLIRERSRSPVWFLFMTSLLACMTLALVVVNAGALYRLRYPYFIPIILLGVRGVDVLITNRKTHAPLLQKSTIS